MWHTLSDATTPCACRVAHTVVCVPCGTHCPTRDPVCVPCGSWQASDLSFVGALGESLEPTTYLPNEFIVTAGHVTRCMWFIRRGRVEFITPPEKARSRPAHHTTRDGGHTLETPGRGSLCAYSACSCSACHRAARARVWRALVTRRCSLTNRVCGDWAQAGDGPQCSEEKVTYGGVLGLFVERQHRMAIRSVGYTDCYKLDREMFERAVQDYPVTDDTYSHALWEPLVCAEALTLTRRSPLLSPHEA